MFDSDRLAKCLNDKILLHRFPIGVWDATHRTLCFQYSLGVVEDLVRTGELLSRTISNFSFLLICSLNEEFLNLLML